MAGNFNAYRSVVNLGSGVKVFAADFSYFSPTNKWFDRVELHGTNWADPYNTVRFNMGKSNLYNFAFNWTDIASFNFLPTWADVTINQGILLNQQSLDMYQKNIDAELNLLAWSLVSTVLGLRAVFQFRYGNHRLRCSVQPICAALQLQQPRPTIIGAASIWSFQSGT